MRDIARRTALLILTCASAALAQSATTARLPSTTRVCDMSARVIAIRLLTKSGAAIPNATMSVRRIRGNAAVAGAGAMGGQGDYKILEDGSMPDIRPAGEPFDVTFSRDGKTKRVRLVIGLDASGCHLEVRRGATTVTM